MTTKSALLMIFGALIASAGFISGFFFTPAFADPAIRDENNIPAVFGSSCDTASATTVSIGNQASVQIQATTSERAYVKVQQPANATNTVSVVLNDVVATIGAGIQLSPSTSTTDLPGFFKAGLATEFPYTGAIKVITSSGSTTVIVTSCTY